MADELEVVDSTNDTGAETETSEVTETEEVDVAKLQETNKKLYARAKEAEAEVKKLKGSKTDVTKSPLPDSSSLTEERLARIELRADGYSAEEVDEIMGLGGVKALQNPLIKKAVEVMRKERRSKDSSPEISPKSPVFKKFTQEDLTKMSRKELENLLPHA